MLFNSYSFLLFFPIVFIMYWCCPGRFRWTVLLAASYYFYMSWNVKYIALILFTTVISYVCARLIEKYQVKKVQKAIVAGSLIVCLGVLFVFKYFNFFSESVSGILTRFSIPVHPVLLKLMLPVGISFYTFQTLSYVIDVYRGDIAAEKHFGKYATFISFFPQLVAGPIERATNLLPQIKHEHKLVYEDVTYGLKMMLWGFYKKVVVADALSVYVDRIYDDVTNYHGGALIISSVLFAIQIYCDFSGYSDIAIGSANVFGIKLMTNFASPYFSSSIREFWSRWHISLSTWFKDYLYIPLGGNRCSKSRQRFNLLVTFLVSGLWHGANWTYVIWGALHGLAQVIENAFTKKKVRYSSDRRMTAGRALRIVGVFAFCCLAWVFFRANNINDAFYIFRNCFDGISSLKQYVANSYIDMQIDKYAFIKLASFIALLTVYDYVSLRKNVIETIRKWPLGVGWAVYIAVTFIIIIFGTYGPTYVAADFIYFQF